MFGKKQLIVVSEPDVQAALAHPRNLPYRKNLPVAWDRQRLLAQIRSAVPVKAKVRDWFAIGPGLYGLVMPFGVDLADMDDSDGRLQVWITIRQNGTDPADITEL